MPKRTAIKADLHSHTTASDGALSPAELVREAAERGITHLAVSDHDTTAGLAEAEAEAVKHGLRIIPSVELTCRVWRNERFTTVHILGIGVQRDAASLLAYINTVEESRRKRYWTMIDKLRTECGLHTLDPKDFEPERDGSLGRPQIARKLVELGRVKRLQQAFDYWLGGGKPAYVPHEVPGPGVAIATINDAGGIPVVAHSGKYRDGFDLAEELFALGLRGVEVQHPDHGETARARLADMARKHGAFMTGGADFHEFGSPNARFFGECYCDPDEFARIGTALQIAVA